MNWKATRYAAIDKGYKVQDIDCTSKHSLCGSRCCKNDVYLTMDEVNSGLYEWDENKPYALKKDSNGFCSYLKELKCSLYPNSPAHCRGYVCGYFEKGKKVW